MNPVYVPLMAACVGVLASAVLAAAVHIGRKLQHVVAALNDFPPHRHINGFISYPKGFEPTEIERLAAKTAH